MCGTPGGSGGCGGGRGDGGAVAASPTAAWVSSHAAPAAGIGPLNGVHLPPPPLPLNGLQDGDLAEGD
eukprot:291641-Chlamydomonas_euryale.AAC.2